uniref:aspartate--tRNA ligase n=1 Tax=Neobodo designis TaxID=312471 RepID=A0A7S1L4S5_NEODS|mmetsp:Transcript_14728/g.45670  ORF Transcript_14728/g.45670 Transcript_14728/m.45670 type:complete len:583 (+) Transcript_14728:42-1790(+)
MSSEEQKPVAPPEAAGAEAKPEGEPKKKNPKQDAKEARKAARLAEEAEKARQKAELLKQYAATFGNAELIRSTTHKTKVFTTVAALNTDNVGGTVLIRARVHSTRAKGKLAFLVLRETFETVQAVLSVTDATPKEMIDFAGKIAPESIVDVEATVCAPQQPVKSTTKPDIELSINKLHVVSASQPVLPFQFEDASQPDAPAGAEGDAAGDNDARAKVNLETRLNCRWLDMRTRASNALFRVSSRISQYFREFLVEHDFIEIHTPKLIGTASEGGANVFKLPYFGKDAFLAQSPQLYKQMCVMGDMPRVFEVGQVFRAENSNTHRHLTEFVGLDAEMVIDRSYHEVLDVLEAAVTHVLTHTEVACAEAVRRARQLCPAGPVEDPGPIVPAMLDDHPLRSVVGCDADGTAGSDLYGARVGSARLPVLRIAFDGAMRLLVDSGDIDAPADDFNTAMEKALGVRVKDRYGVDLVLCDAYPSTVRPFYTQRDPADDTRTLSYDLLLRGQEICSGAQRLHDMGLLAERAEAAGVTLANIRPYIDAFAYGAWPHGGFGIGQQRLVMLYLGLPDVRYASFFPRDPARISP